MTPTMREKLARAVDQAMTGAGNVFDPAPQAYRDKCFAIVDAILNVLREPDEAMVEAGFPAWRESEGASDDELGRAALRVWHAMLDTITNEGRG